MASSPRPSPTASPARPTSNKDGFVYLTELDSYLFERVKKLSNNRQHAVMAKPASVVPFVLSRP